MLDRWRAYTRAELEAALGEPQAAFNGGDLSPLPWGGGWYDDELPIREEPRGNGPYCLVWPCGKSGPPCWAIGNPNDDEFHFVMMCARHDAHDPHRGRSLTHAEIDTRDAWLADFWPELARLDGVEITPGGAGYDRYRIELEAADETDLREIELCRFVIRADVEAPACGSYGFSVQNTTPHFGALSIIRSVLHGAEADVWLAGRRGPDRIRVTADHDESSVFGRTAGGAAIEIPPAATCAIVWIRAL